MQLKHQVLDAADDATTSAVTVETDRHGLSVTLPDGQILVLDYSNATFSLYHFAHEGDDNHVLLGYFSNGYASLPPKE